VLTGLHAGDRVIVDGVTKVAPGQPVTIVPGAMQPPAGNAPGKGTASAGPAAAR
jgi:hypothetical protein